jgi:hypothetical protein
MGQKGGTRLRHGVVASGSCGLGALKVRDKVHAAESEE